MNVPVVNIFYQNSKSLDRLDIKKIVDLKKIKRSIFLNAVTAVLGRLGTNSV